MNKRRKTQFEDHPNGVLPSGNAFWMVGEEAASSNAKAKMGSFRSLSDQQILDFLEILGPRTCAKLSNTCKALYVFAQHDELWRGFVLCEYKGEFLFKTSWKQTFSNNLHQDNIPPVIPLKVQGFFSDLLYCSWRCTVTPLEDLCRPSEENIDRRSKLSMKEFLEEYAIPQKPVILTDVVENWPAYSSWNLDFFAKRRNEQLYRAEAVDISFQKYLAYMNQAKEESPLYLFDKFSLKNDASLAADYKVPCYFNQDLFQFLGDKRPDYRWIIIGPERSSSSFHIDPNATAAWNAVITGSKKWILTPPNQPPPGVYPSKDGSEVTSPVSLAEWYLNHYEEMKEAQKQNDLIVYEAVCRKGEMIYVPSRFWHSVMNMEPTIAITQNFVSDYNLQQVLEFTKFKPEQVSGFCTEEQDLFTAFSQSLQKKRPSEWAAINQERLNSNRKTQWQRLTSATTPSTTDQQPSNTGFSFCFEDEQLEE